MISQTSEYALRAVVCLAQNSDKPHTTAEIARVTKVPEHYLSKVFADACKTRSGLFEKGIARGIHVGPFAGKFTVVKCNQRGGPHQTH